MKAIVVINAGWLGKKLINAIESLYGLEGVINGGHVAFDVPMEDGNLQCPTAMCMRASFIATEGKVDHVKKSQGMGQDGLAAVKCLPRVSYAAVHDHVMMTMMETTGFGMVRAMFPRELNCGVLSRFDHDFNTSSFWFNEHIIKLPEYEGLTDIVQEAFYEKQIDKKVDITDRALDFFNANKTSNTPSSGEVAEIMVQFLQEMSQ